MATKNAAEINVEDESGRHVEKVDVVQAAPVQDDTPESTTVSLVETSEPPMVTTMAAPPAPPLVELMPAPMAEAPPVQGEAVAEPATTTPVPVPGPTPAPIPERPLTAAAVPESPMLASIPEQPLSEPVPEAPLPAPVPEAVLLPKIAAVATTLAQSAPEQPMPAPRPEQPEPVTAPQAMQTPLTAPLSVAVAEPPLPVSTKIAISAPDAQPESIATTAVVALEITDPTYTTVNLNVNVQTNGDKNGNAITVEAAEAEQQQGTQSTESSKGKMDADATLANFKVLYVLAQLCGLTMIVLVGSWVGVHMGGLAGTSQPQFEFNWHPLLMTVGLIFLYGNSILIYRGFRTTRKKTLKISHACIHMGAFILTVIALKTVFDSHNLAPNPIPNMYSLHSWLGLSAVLLFCMQYVAGFVAYLAPGLKESYKVAYMPLHIYFGLFGFVLSVAAALMGLTEKAIFSIKAYSDLPSSGVMANMCGMMFVAFAGLVVYLATEPSYKRKPIPEDAVLLTGVNE